LFMVCEEGWDHAGFITIPPHKRSCLIQDPSSLDGFKTTDITAYGFGSVSDICDLT
jgi:hypothetical protein